jgi:outer membrane protein assembly factor BamB
LVGKDKFIFAMDTLGLLTSFDLNNSKVVWQKKIGTRETTYTANPGGLSLFQNTLYAHLGGLNLVALNASTGEILWEKNFQMPIVSGPASNKRGVFITLINGTLKYLKDSNGELIWERKVISKADDVMSTASISLSEEIAIVPEFGGLFSVLSLEDGSYLWEDNLALLSPKTAIEKMSSIKAEPSISDKTFFVIAQNGRLASYDLINNKMIWEQKISGSQIVWIAGSSIFVISDNAELICLRKVDGAIRWITNLPGKIDENLLRYKKFIPHFGPVIGSDKIYVAGSDKKLRIFNYKDGKLIEEKKFSSSISTPPIIINSILYILDDNAKLFAFK